MVLAFHYYGFGSTLLRFKPFITMLQTLLGIGMGNAKPEGVEESNRNLDNMHNFFYREPRKTSVFRGNSEKVNFTSRYYSDLKLKDPLKSHRR